VTSKCTLDLNRLFITNKCRVQWGNWIEPSIELASRPLISSFLVKVITGHSLLCLIYTPSLLEIPLGAEIKFLSMRIPLSFIMSRAVFTSHFSSSHLWENFRGSIVKGLRKHKGEKMITVWVVFEPRMSQWELSLWRIYSEVITIHTIFVLPIPEYNVCIIYLKKWSHSDGWVEQVSH